MAARAWRASRRDRALRATALVAATLGLALGCLMLAASASAAPPSTEDGDDALAAYPAPPPVAPEPEPAPEQAPAYAPIVPALAPAAPAVLPERKRRARPAQPDPAPAVVAVAPAAAATLVWSFDLEGEDGIALEGRELRPGDRIRIRASGLPAAAEITVALHSTPLAMGSGSATAAGDLDLTATVPDEAEPGDHRVVATLTAPGYAPSTASSAVTVAAPYPWLSPTVPTLGDLRLTPLKVAATATLASAFLLLAAIPAELLQSTLTENYGRAFGWARRRHPRRRLLPPALRRPWLTSGATVVLATAILGLGQTGWHLSAEAVISYLSLFLSLTVLNLGLNAGRLLAARRRLRAPGRLMPMPGALLVVAVSVAISQVLHIEPALLFGAVVTVQYGRAMSRRNEGRLALLGVATAFGIGLASWILLSLLEGIGAGSEGVALVLVEETLAGVVLETLAALVVGLLPFTYLDGKAIHDWHRRAWAGAYFVAAAAFVLIAVPTGEDWQESRTPLLTWLLIVAGFGAISLTAWAVFRYLPERARTVPGDPEDPRDDARERVAADA
ncbi:hypothetical protein QQX09_13265 [Demequina sp. SYSU T00192]|uniref:Uncharacterized protein n=1 Tax=Demequina litoralis TaxID=3051660 RepID=A0ABT8GCF7_9MICO|nr:hypothetical protein [Demequina sp. SYSU T00192]MDN4476823.1 hypothetical protein [Demequina sp. SYSU T00192]